MSVEFGIHYAPNFEKVGSILLSACPCVCLKKKLKLGFHTCDISLFRRELPIFCPFLRKSPYENFIISLYILYISLFGNPDLPTKIQKFPSLFNHSPYLEKEISLFVFPSVSHVWGFKISYMDSLSKNSLPVFFFLSELSPLAELCPFWRVRVQFCK